SPAASTVGGPVTRGTATEMLEIFRNSRRETPESSSGFLASSLGILTLRVAETHRPGAGLVQMRSETETQLRHWTALVQLQLVLIANFAGRKVYNLEGAHERGPATFSLRERRFVEWIARRFGECGRVFT